MSYEGRSQWPHHAARGSSASASNQNHHHHHHPLSLPEPQPRHHGRGYDFRRPVMSNIQTPPSEEIVDLTNDPNPTPPRFSRPPPSHTQSSRDTRPPHRRLPRFGRNIMADVVDLEEDDAQADDEPTEVINLDPPSSPEVQFVRARSRPTSRPAAFATPVHLLEIINLQGYLTTQEAFRQEIALQTRRMGRLRSRRPNVEEMLFAGDTNQNIDLTIDLDYQAPGFTISDPTSATPPDSYKPPSPPPAGFTRTVGEDDVVVCPNCDRELGIGEGPRQQIWVAKSCGHVCLLFQKKN